MLQSSTVAACRCSALSCPLTPSLRLHKLTGFDFFYVLLSDLNSNLLANVKGPYFLFALNNWNLRQFWRVSRSILFVIVSRGQDFSFSFYLVGFELVLLSIGGIIMSTSFDSLNFIKIPFNCCFHGCQIHFCLLLFEFLLLFDPVFKLNVRLFIEGSVLSRFYLLLDFINLGRSEARSVRLAVSLKHLFRNQHMVRLKHHVLLSSSFLIPFPN